MKSTVIWSLVLLNAVLLGSLVSRWIEPTAQAQARRPGDYLVIPGEVIGAQAGLLYIIDSTTRDLTAVAYDENKKRLVAMPRISLENTFRTTGGRR